MLRDYLSTAGKMPDKMDIDNSVLPPPASPPPHFKDASRSASSPSTTRDPRLGNRLTIDTNVGPQVSHSPTLNAYRTAASAIPNSAVNSQQQLVSAQDSHAPPGDFARALSELVQTAVVLEKCKTEKATLEKHAARMHRNSRKAVSHPYPPTAAFFQHAKEADNASLRRIDTALHRHQSMCRNIEESITTKWTQTHDNSETNSRLAELESKFAQLEARQSSSQEAQRLFEKSLDHSTNRYMELTSNFEKHKLTVGDMVREVQSIQRSRSASSPEASRKVHSNKEAQINGRTSEERPNDQTTQTKVEIDPNLMASMDQKVAGFEDRLRVVEDKCSTSFCGTPDWQVRAEALEREVQDHTAQFQEIVNIQEMKDAAHMAQLDTLETTMAKQDEKMNLLESWHGEMSKTLADQGMVLLKVKDDCANHVSQRQADWDQEIQHLKTGLHQLVAGVQQQWAEKAQTDSEYRASLGTLSDKVHQVLNDCAFWTQCKSKIETHSVSIRSLENRLSNMTTEHLVRHMARTMQEMYPSIGEVQDQLKALKSSFEKDIPELNQKVEALQPGLDERLAALKLLIDDDFEKRLFESKQTILKDQSQHCHWINELQNRDASLEQTLSELHDQIAKSPPKKYDELQNRITDLESKINGYKGNLMNLAKDSVENDAPFDQLKDQVKDLVQQFDSLANDVRTFKANGNDDLRRFIAECSQEECKKLQAGLQKRVRELENLANSKEISSMFESLDRLEARSEGPTQSVRDRSKRPGEGPTSPPLGQHVVHRSKAPEEGPGNTSPLVDRVQFPGASFESRITDRHQSSIESRDSADSSRTEFPPKRKKRRFDSDGSSSFSRTNSSSLPSCTDDQPKKKKKGKGDKEQK